MPPPVAQVGLIERALGRGYRRRLADTLELQLPQCGEGCPRRPERPRTAPR